MILHFLHRFTKAQTFPVSTAVTKKYSINLSENLAGVVRKKTVLFYQQNFWLVQKKFC